MNRLVAKNSRRLAAHWAVLLSFAIAIIFVIDLDVLGSHNGPIISVDAFAHSEEDHDGDFHFKTLQAALQSKHLKDYSVIQVAAGRYIGDIVLRHEGLELRSSKGPLQTAIQGQVTISARNVVINGFSFESRDSSSAVLEIAHDGLVLENSRISGAKHGLVIRGVHGASLRMNEIYDHSDTAVVVEDSWNVEIEQNEIRGSGWAAISIDDSHDLRVENNTINLNQFGGIWLKNSQRARVVGNHFENNGIVGISLDRASEVEVADNEFRANDVGVVLVHSMGNEVRNNVIHDGRTSGLVIKNDSQGNLVQGNTIRGNQGRGAVGIRIAGNVHANEFVDNSVIENGAGLSLAENDTGSPMNNIFRGNEIVFSDSSGVEIDRFAQYNSFINNDIHHNLEDGIASAGQLGIYENNKIFDNGLSGLLMTGASDSRVEGNSIYGNGAQGISMQNTSGSLLVGNEILDNLRDGVAVSDSRQLRMLDNLVARNGGIGVNLSDVERLALIKNRIDDNSNLGVFLNGAEIAVLEENEILGNGNGGLRLEDVTDANIEGNHFEDNMRYGLYVLNSDQIAALRNYWGDPAGPAGGFAGSGDAALGLEIDSLSPWLPAAPADLVLRTVSGEMIETMGGQRVRFDASDRLGLMLDFHGSELESERNRDEMGLVVAAKHSERPEIAPELAGAAGFYSLNVDGISMGTVDITAFYSPEDLQNGVDAGQLRLFVLRNGQWESLPGSVSPELRRVTGEIEAGALQGVLLGIGTFSGSGVEESTPFINEETEDMPSSDPVRSEDQSNASEEEVLAVGTSQSGPPSDSGSDWLLIGSVSFATLLILFGAGFYALNAYRSSRPPESKPEEDEIGKADDVPTPSTKPAHVFRSWPL